MSVWNEIQNQLNIVDVIGEYIQVKQLGSTYKAVCPFHQDKNPSLIISPEKNLWHCFGCGAGGDMFAFVSQFENIDKAETLKKLAKKAGIELPKFYPKETPKTDQKVVSKFELGLKYLDWSTGVYHKILLKILENRNHPVSQYCLQRNLTLETIKKFKLGYAFSQNTILDLAKKHNLDLELFEQISILKQSPKGVQDKFKDRLMIPIFDNLGKVRGFTGRILPYDKTERPKYLNSSQSDWFKKSEIWYGWSLNQKEIRQAKKAIIVEGNMDVIAASQKNLNISLASQGTSFTVNQLQILNRLVKTIWIAFDNDEAGRLSSKKLFIESSKLGFSVWQLVIPKNYKDLDEYLQAEFPLSVDIEKDLTVVPFLEYQITLQQLNLQSQQLHIQKQALVDILDLLEFCDQITIEDILQKLSKISQKSVSALQSFLPKSKTNYSDKNAEIVVNQNEPIQNEFLVRYQNLIAIIANQHQYDITKIEPQQLELLQNLHLVCMALLPEIKNTENFETYFLENLEMFKVISQNITTPKITLINGLKQNINSFVQVILFDSQLSSAYQQIQQNLNNL